MGRKPNYPIPLNIDEAETGWVVCNKCGLAKPPEKFSKDRTRRNGLNNSCKECFKADRREYNKAYQREYQRKRRAKMREEESLESKLKGLEHPM